MKILVLGDSYCPSASLRPAFDALQGHDVEFADVEDEPDWQPTSASEANIKELLGSPAQVSARLADHEVLVVQAAPVTDAVLAAAPSLRLVCVVRGGPVNVDVDAASERGIQVVTTPGKNATAVAELTIAMMVMVARRVVETSRHVASMGELYVDNYEGAAWFGHDLSGHCLGLIGFGQVGRRVASRARAFEMRVLAHDPFVEAADMHAADVEAVELDDLLDRADYVSLHARVTAETRRMIGAERFGRMKPGSYLINTARHELVDEDALAEALQSGRLAGAALDVATPSPQGSRHRLEESPNVVLLPHIGGATLDTLANGGHMAVAEIERLAAGHPLLNMANPKVTSVASASP